MYNNLNFYITLCIIMVVLLIMYFTYVIVDEKKKIKYYNSNIKYDTDWDKYRTMVKKQKKIYYNKKIELLWLTLLVKIKRGMQWKH